MPSNTRSKVLPTRTLWLACLMIIGACLQSAHAADPWITGVSGIRKNQQAAGTLHIQTHVTGLDRDADYDLRYQVDGPSGFIYTARDLPFTLGGQSGWNTSNAIPGEYTLHAFLIRNHRCIAFRIIEFTIGDGTQITEVQGVSQGQSVTEATQVQAFIKGVKPSRVVFDLDGPLSLTHTERYDPYFMLGDNATWQVDTFPEGLYTLNVTAYQGDTTADTQAISFYLGEPPEGAEVIPPVPDTTPDDSPGIPTDDDPEVIPPIVIPAEPGPLPDGYDRGFLGINLAEVTYYTREWVFVNAMKQSHRWLPTTPGSSAPWDSGESLKLNENGYPILGTGQAAHTLMLIDNDGAYPAGRYVCTYDGDGQIEFEFDATVVSRNGNRIELDVTPSNNGIYLRIDRSNPANPVRNIRVMMPGFENAESSFHPLYIERLRPFSVIRFMDWMRTNGSDIASWSDRPNKDNYSQGTDDGVALEYMIELCNELGADPWFCMPHNADDAYVYSFAKQVKLRLRPDLNVYIEWSNEVWNSQFEQHKWVQEVTGSDSLSEPFRRRWAQEADRDFDIWRDVFADESDRVIRLAVGQKDNPWVTEQLAKELDGQFDAISCSTYFGFTRGQKSQLNDSTSASTILDWALTEMSRSLRDNYQAHGSLARNWSNTLGRTIPLIGYEGGQHYTADGGSPPWANALIDAQRHPRMYQAYIANLREWKNAGGSLFTAFNFIDKPDKWGSWGQLEYMDQDISKAPKYRALLEFEP